MLPTSECWTLAELEFRKNLHTLGKERQFTYKLHSTEERVSDDQTQNRQQTPKTCGLVRTINGSCHRSHTCHSDSTTVFNQESRTKDVNGINIKSLLQIHVFRSQKCWD